MTTTTARVTGPELAQALLAPRSIALYGASDDTAKTAGRPLKFLRAAGFQGALYPVNPNRPTVQGERAWPDLASLPEVPQQVFVLMPTESVLGVVRECARLGVAVVTILASGFAEAGAQGAVREQELRALALSSGVRVLGPSSLGIVNPATGLVLTANAAFAEPELPRGRVFVASHSGSMIGALVSRGKARGIGFAGLVSVGGEADLSVGEICAATLDDPGIDGYLLFLESLRHGAQLRAFALEAARRGKPVIAYKLGRSPAAAEMAATHTGALAGEDDVADAFFKDMGVARVGVLDALLETFPLAARIALADGKPRRVGVVTTTGGGSAMAVDQLGIRNVTVEPPSAQTLAQLAAAGISVQPGRVVDLTLAGTRYEVMKSAIEIMQAAPEFDLVLVVVGSSARFQPQLAVKPILDCAADRGRATKPLAALLVPDAPQALAMLTEAGLPCFQSPEACADAIAAVFARCRPGPQPALPTVSSAVGRPLSEAEAYAVLGKLGVPHAPFVTLPLSVAVADTLPFEFPVVAKICSAQIQHKTEVGGVVLGIADPAELTAALVALRSNLNEHAPNIACDLALVQPMCGGAVAEVLLGYRVDAEAGPIVMLAAGGIWAEVARDRSIRLAPLDIDAAREMIGEVRALQAATGLRGRPRGDLEALAHAVSALSQLALRPDLHIAEAEINPLLVLRAGEGVLAVDALVLMKDEHA